MSLKLVILTPSMIRSRRRVDLARRSFHSLREVLGATYTHIVVDDIPTIFRMIPDFRWRDEAPKVYGGENVKLIRGYGNGSASATQRALHEAEGADLALIHLDDTIYLPCLKEMIAHAVHAFETNSDLRLIRLGGFPLLDDRSDPRRGNLSLLELSPDSVTFAGHIFEPRRAADYTLWSTPFSPSMANSPFWCLVQWLAIYRADFLRTVLETARSDNRLQLAHVELYYRNTENWRRFLDSHPGRIGYINMQFAGHEMDRTTMWRELLQYPNTPVR